MVKLPNKTFFEEAFSRLKFFPTPNKSNKIKIGKEIRKIALDIGCTERTVRSAWDRVRQIRQEKQIKYLKLAFNMVQYAITSEEDRSLKLKEDFLEVLYIASKIIPEHAEPILYELFKGKITCKSIIESHEACKDHEDREKRRKQQQPLIDEAAKRGMLRDLKGREFKTLQEFKEANNETPFNYD